MAATAPAARRRDADDDIAAIAKQISDQAEAIYQNWKARGLGPADLLSCHAAGDAGKLGSMLKPQPSAKPSIDLLAQAPTMDNNRLEKLVKNFVHEDKARLAAARNQQQQQQQQKAMPSSIQYALQKFERNTAQTNGVGPAALPAVKKAPAQNSYAQQKPAVPGQKPQILPKPRLPAPAAAAAAAAAAPGPPPPLNGLQTWPLKNRVVTSDIKKTTSFTHHPEPPTPTPAPPPPTAKPHLSPKPAATAHLGDTIEMTLPADAAPPAGLQTWPLKNRVISTDNVKKSAQPQQQHPHHTPNTYHTLPARPSAATIDQVALEEKRLINALKNGDVVNEEPPVISAVKNIVPMNLVVVPKEPEKSEIATKTGLRGTPRRPEQQVPHPELSPAQRQHLRQASAAAAAAAAAGPVRPFLTRGSVAERVLIFERRPAGPAAGRLLLDKRPAPSAAAAAAGAALHLLAKPQPLPKQPSLQHTTLQRHVRAHRNVNIPKFHFPTGKPGPPGQLETIKARVTAAFATIGERAYRDNFAAIVRAVQLPLYWKTPLYLAACGDKDSCTLEQFFTFWQGMASTCHDQASRFVYILTRGRRNWLAPNDFIPLVQDVVETHPGLTFLKEATEFHSRYVHTVIARIYYCVNRSWSAKISVPELRRSNLLSIIQLLEEEEDINQITQYFSYEHFYVIYCKFWELDRDHDLFIDKQDLTRHNDHALSTRIIDRIFSGCVTRGNKKQHEERMTYTDFVWFLLSEEDKLHPTAIEYWFRCMDLDGDGFLSMYELEYFYEEQMHRMEAIGIETLPFQDCLCQMLDMVKPKIPGKISLSDLKKCRMTSIFFDTFFNLEKYLDHEQRDPFASQRDHDIDGQEMSEWDRYAAEEYELLVAEEGGNEQQDSLSFDEGNEEDLLSQHLDGALDEGDGQAESSNDSDDCSI